MVVQREEGRVRAKGQQALGQKVVTLGLIWAGMCWPGAGAGGARCPGSSGCGAARSASGCGGQPGFPDELLHDLFMPCLQAHAAHPFLAGTINLTCSYDTALHCPAQGRRVLGGALRLLPAACVRRVGAVARGAPECAGLRPAGAA